MDIQGFVHEGSGRAAPMMKGKDLSLLGYEPYPGTLNVQVGPKIRDWAARQPGLQIPKTERAYHLYIPVRINDQIDGHVSFNRGTRSLEVLAPVNLRWALCLENDSKVRLQLRQTPIPKVMHQVWVGNPMPDHLKKYGEMWQEMHPDWDYKLWSEENLDWLEHQDLFDAWEEHAPRNRGQWQANIARLEILYRFGGVYTDCDMQPLKNIDPLMEQVASKGAFCAWQREVGHKKGPLLTNAFCGSYAGHTAMRSLLDGLRHNVRRNSGMRCTHTSGVKYWTKHILQREKLTGHIDIFPQYVAMPYLPDKLQEIDPETYQAPDTAYLAHHWENQRSGGHTGKYR